MSNERHPLIQNPKVEFTHDDAGRIVGALLRVREGQAVKTTQPNKSKLVFFMLASDDHLIAVDWLEPVPGVIFEFLVPSLSETSDGEPIGVDCAVKHEFLQLEELSELVKRVLDEATKAVRSLEASAAS